MQISLSFLRLLLLAALGISCTASAQTMYRCGSTYQDQPCSGAQPTGSVIGGAGHAAQQDSQDSSGAASASTSAADPACHQRGLAAEKIRWAKEGGRTLQQAQDATAGDPAFLQNVYGRRGTAAEVRVAVEADCNDQQQRALEAARLNAAAAAIMAAGAGARPASSSGALSPAGGATRH